MSIPADIVEVNLDNFAQEVLEVSYQRPVLVDFWASWCQPCQTLSPLLQKLAAEYAGVFRLAMVNSDAEQELVMHFGVRSLPTVKVVFQGQLVAEQIGVQPESVYRQILDQFGPPATVAAEPQDPLEQINQLWQAGHYEPALQQLDALRAQHPDDHTLSLELAERLLMLNLADDAAQILHALPVNIQTEARAQGLLARLQFAEQVRHAPDLYQLEQRLALNPRDYQALHYLAGRLVLAGEFEAALEQLLTLQRIQPSFAEGAARRDMLAIFQILGSEDPLTTQYRRRLASLLM